MTRDRKLSPEEQALWHHVTKQVTPHHPASPSPHDLTLPKLSFKKGRPAPVSTAHPKPVPRKPAQPGPLDGATQRRVRRGKVRIEGRLDLHGYYQDQAKASLEGFIQASRAQGKKCVLVITGKGSFGAPIGSSPKGVLRQRVPEWLRISPLSHSVLGFEQAHPTHGGAGALYVFLRSSSR